MTEGNKERDVFEWISFQDSYVTQHRPSQTMVPGHAAGRLQPCIQKKSTRVTPGWCQTSFEIIKLCSDWQDPEFLKDVEAATGVDLGSSRSSKKGKGKKKKHPNLTDLRERTNTARARLEKKVFAK